MLAHIPELVNHVASFADVKDFGSFSLANKQFKDAVDYRVTDIRCYNDDALTAGAAERWKNVDSVTVTTWSNIPSIRRRRASPQETRRRRRASPQETRLAQACINACAPPP